MSDKSFTILPQSLKNAFIRAIDIPIDAFIRLKVHPNLFTVLGLLFSMLGGLAYARGALLWGGVGTIVGGICDTFDGKIARKTDRASKFGALFDSSLDRYSEFFMFLGIMVYFHQAEGGLSVLTGLIVFLALCGSIMVSYTRARAEGLGFECKVGVMQRADRIVLIGFSSMIHEVLLWIVLVIVAVLANITAFQRMNHVRVQENNQVENESLDESLGI